jgi:phosphatidylserine/phosphatidylglycerophosphate/cardiolipin synthase-like enzyme
VAVNRWFLTRDERGNPSTHIDERAHPETAWSVGNDVGPVLHGAEYFAELVAALHATAEGDLVMFTDWRGDPDERLDGPGTEVADVLCAAVHRGVLVKGLVWRSHWDKLQFSSEENRHLGDQVNAAGGEVLRDMRVRSGGSHHQKFVVLRHRDRPERDVAFVGGVDLCHGRRDDPEHEGDPQASPMSKPYGPRPPWHDAHVAVRGPAVGDIEAVFRERWDDHSPLTRNPVRRLRDALSREDTSPSILPLQLPDPRPCGRHAVQVLRTYPYRGAWAFPFAPRGERSIARAYLKAIGQAQRLIYVEDQYLWSPDVARPFAEALARNPELRVIVPRYPDQDSRLSGPPQDVGRNQALALLHEAGGDRLAVYSIENHHGTPVYVHAKTCVVDDVWMSIGSDNLSMRSWTYDSELTCAVIDEESLAWLGDAGDGDRGAADHAENAGPGRDAGAGEESDPGRDAGVEQDGSDSGRHRQRVNTATLDRTPDAPLPAGFAQSQRLRLAREHLDRAEGDDADLRDPMGAYAAFAASADALDAWYEGGRQGPRPAGRLRRYRSPRHAWPTRLWAGGLYRRLYDPDGRPRDLRRGGEF